MEINVLIDEDLEGCLEVSWLQNVAEQVLIAQKTGSDVEFSLVITSQERMQQLNRDYLGEDEPTDVLAFGMLPEKQGKEEPEMDIPSFVAPPDGILHLGEVIISYPQAVMQADEHQHSVKKEIAILAIHGVLHLLGYDHGEPEAERRMRAKEKAILNCLKMD